MSDPAAAVTFSFVNATNANATEVNTDFNDLISWVNAYAIRRDGTVAFTAPVTGITPTGVGHLVTKAYADNGPPALVIQDVDLATDNASDLVGTFSQWGTEQITVSNPGRAVSLSVSLTGHVRAEDAGLEASEYDTQARIDVSVDGGSTWAYSSLISWGSVKHTEFRRATIATQDVISGVTPTGDIKVRAMIALNTYTAASSPNVANVTFRSGNIQVIMKPV